MTLSLRFVFLFLIVDAAAADIHRYAQQRIQQSIAECNSPASSNSPNSTLSRNNASPTKRVPPTPGVTLSSGGSGARACAAQPPPPPSGSRNGGGGSGTGSNSSLEATGVSVVASSRLLLGSISRVLLLADRIVVKQLLATIHKVRQPLGLQLSSCSPYLSTDTRTYSYTFVLTQHTS